MKSKRLPLFLLFMFLCLLGIGANVSAGLTDEWPMFHHDDFHTGYSTSTGPTTNNVLWTYQTGGEISSSPAVINGRVYVGSTDGIIYCINAYTGKLIWSYTTNGDIGSSPAVSNGRVYVGSHDKYLYCLDAETGGFKWRYETNNWVSSSPTIVDGLVYVGSYDGYLYCLDAYTGKFKWKFQAGSTSPPPGGLVGSSPAVYEGKVYILGQYLYCLNAFTGDKIWSNTTFSDGNASPVISEGLVYIGYSLPGWGRVDCYDALTGKYIWHYTPGAAVTSTPAIAYGYIFFSSCDDKVYGLDADTGAFEWSFHAGSYEIRSSPAVADGLVYFGDHNLHGNGKIYCLDSYTGEVVWSYETGHERVYSSPAIYDGKVYIGAGDGKLYCFAQTQIWSSDFEGYPKDVFTPGESVYASVPSIDQEVDIYVTHARSWINGDSITDVSDGVETVILSSGPGVETYHVWSSSLLGSYDIVMDVNQNNVFDDGTDLVDSIDVMGFFVIPETSLGTIATIFSSLIALSVYINLKRHAL